MQNLLDQSNLNLMANDLLHNLFIIRPLTIRIDDPADQTCVDVLAVALTFYEFKHSICDLLVQWFKQVVSPCHKRQLKHNEYVE